MPAAVDSQESQPGVRPLVLYDGGCGLCHRLVRWLLAHEADPRLQFAPLQGATTSRLRAAGLPIPDTLDSVALVDAGRIFLRARAVARMAASLRWPWRALTLLRFIPLLPDLGYRLVASNRLRWFGRVDSCLLPDPSNPARLLP